MAEETVHYRTCPFCEATCGLAVTMRGDEVVSVRGDDEDVFSHGFICPKSQGLKALHEDPDRLTAPLVRRDGELVEASWEEAFAEVDRGLSAVLADGGRDAVAVYLGNPSRPQPRSDALRPGVQQGARVEEHLLAPRPSIRCRSRSRPASCSAPGSASRSPTSTAPTTC